MQRIKKGNDGISADLMQVGADLMSDSITRIRNLGITTSVYGEGSQSVSPSERKGCQ